MTTDLRAKPALDLAQSLVCSYLATGTVENVEDVWREWVTSHGDEEAGELLGAFVAVATAAIAHTAKARKKDPMQIAARVFRDIRSA